MDNFAYISEFEGSEEKSKEDVKPVPKVENIIAYTFEEAIELTGIGIYHYFLQLVCGLCLMSAVIDVMGTSMVIPFFSNDIPATVGELSFLSSVSYLGTIISSHALGFFSDTWGRTKMLRTTIATSIVSGIITAFSVNIWMLITFRFLSGLVLSGCMAIVYSLVGEFHSQRTRAKYITMLSMFSPLGIMLIPAFGLAILPLHIHFHIFEMEFHSWRLFLLVICFIRIIILVGLLLIPESPKYDFIQGDHDKTLKTLRMVFSKNMGKPVYEYPVQRISADGSGGSLKNVTGVKDAFHLVWTQTIPIFSKDKVLQTMNLCFSMFVIYAISHGVFMWLPTILIQQTENKGSSLTACEIMNLPRNNSVITTALPDDYDNEDLLDRTIFIILICFGATFTILYYVISIFVENVGKKNMLFGWIASSGISCIVFVYVTDFAWSVVVLTLISSLNSAGGIVSTLAMEFFPTNVNAMGMCLMMMIGRIGSFVGSNFVGMLIKSNCELVFYLYFGSSVIIAVLTLFLPSVKRRK